MPPIAFGGGLPPIEEILSMLAEDLGIGNSRREPAGPTPADRPDPGDPLLGERLRRAKMDDSADAPHDAHQETLVDQEIFAELDRLEELIDDSGLRGAPVVRVAGPRRQSAGRAEGAAGAGQNGARLRGRRSP